MCFNCGEEGHWSNECPEMIAHQMGQLTINLGEEDGDSKEGAVMLVT